eukprot:m.193003 g.193003  ORF g.193003 m.193003 type:complete len:98 (-) comp15174_c0_seq2:193-486(-)
MVIKVVFELSTITNSIHENQSMTECVNANQTRSHPQLHPDVSALRDQENVEHNHAALLLKCPTLQLPHFRSFADSRTLAEASSSSPSAQCLRGGPNA